VKLAISGAAGRMGQALIEAAGADRDLELVVLHDVASGGNPKITSDNAALASADVVIDFTRPSATLAHLAHAKAMVIGTTGFSETEKKTIVDAAKRIPIVMAANFAVGVNATYKLAETAAKILGDAYDVEIIEAHHRHKVDAPSGTALELGRIVERALGGKLDPAYGRSGEPGARPKKQIGFHSIRGGDIVGEHTVVFAGAGERIEVTVRSQSRATYAQGALRAAKWLKGKPPKLYGMADVLGL
jgi:4-hydroxy-tetrahydrodipicolinate reductase